MSLRDSSAADENRSLAKAAIQLIHGAHQVGLVAAFAGL
jgi:hypothetical protein